MQQYKPRPNSSLSEHVAREIQRDYPGHSTRNVFHRRQQTSGAVKNSTRGIKSFLLATASGVRRISVATGKKSINVTGRLGRSVTNLTRKALDEWSYADVPENCNPSLIELTKIIRLSSRIP
jgi:hypothetical protein